jgi:predicted ATPase/class 3 adenylate cyclase
MTAGTVAPGKHRPLPHGTVTLLFTDIEESTEHVRRLGDRYDAALSEHRRLLREAFARNHGVEVDTQGDAFFVVFERAVDALTAAADAQRALAAHEWPGGIELRARIGVHSGEPTLSTGGYYVGVDLTRGARICAAAHGGQILFSETTATLVGEQVDALELGAHTLKGVESPERLFQLLATGLRANFPPPRAPRPGNVPVPRTELVGRRTELTAVVDLLKGEAPIVTVTGAGGTGKTRLAVEAAHAVAPAFRDGAFFVSFAGVDDPVLVPAVLASVLDVGEQGSETVVQALVRTLAGRELLLLLDNFEQVVEGAGAVAGLLSACPRLRVLATSRERLNLVGEHEYPLPPLERSDAAALFAARARAASPEVDLEGGWGEVVEAICSRLDGLPLAVELAAARVRMLPLAAILERLEQRLPFLTDGPRDLPERQRTLRATIDWSYGLLDETEKVVLARLAVFAGGWTLEAAATIAEQDDVLPLLTSLRDKSLIVPRVGSEGGPRFAMLDTIAEYALQRLGERGDEAPVRRLHAQYFLQLAERGEPELQGPEQAVWLAHLAEEHRNIRAALRWADETGEDELLLRIAGALWRFWFIRGHLAEGRTWLGRALERRPTQPSSWRANALLGATTLAAADDDTAAAQALATERLQVCRELGGDEGIAGALGGLANVTVMLGAHADAARLYEQAAYHASAAEAEGALAAIVNNLGYVMLLDGDATGGEARCREAARLFGELGSRDEAAGAWLNVAIALLAQSRAPDALSVLAGCLRTYADVQHADGISYCLDACAAAYAELGELRPAAVLSGAARGIAHRTGGTPPPLERALRDRTELQLKRDFGAGPFADACREGEALTQEAAIELASAAVPPAS